MNEPLPPTTTPLTKYVLAIDGGGSKVSALLAKTTDDQQPQIVVRHTINATGSAAQATWPDARSNLLRLIEEIVAKAEIQPSSIAKATLMLAGAGRPVDVERVSRSLLESSTVKDIANLIVTSDIQPMLAYATNKEPRLPTIVVISGTGSIVATLDGQQQMIRAGGWGPVLGDEASGFRIAQLALSAACQWIDADFALDRQSHISNATIDFLVQRGLLASDATKDRTQIASALLQLVTDRHATARLAPIVLDYYRTDKPDELSRQIDEQFGKLAKQVEMVMRRAFGQSNLTWRLGLAGGLAVQHPVFREFLIAQLEEINLVPAEIFELDPLTAAIAGTFLQCQNCD